MQSQIKTFSCAEALAMLDAYERKESMVAFAPVESLAVARIAQELQMLVGRAAPEAAGASSGFRQRKFRPAAGYAFCFVKKNNEQRAEVWTIATFPRKSGQFRPQAVYLGHADITQLPGGFDDFCADAPRFARQGVECLLEISTGNNPEDRAFDQGEEEAAAYREIMAQAGFSGEGIAREEAAEMREMLAQVKREQAGQLGTMESVRIRRNGPL